VVGHGIATDDETWVAHVVNAETKLQSLKRNHTTYSNKPKKTRQTLLVRKVSRLSFFLFLEGVVTEISFVEWYEDRL